MPYQFYGYKYSFRNNSNSRSPAIKLNSSECLTIDDVILAQNLSAEMPRQFHRYNESKKRLK